MKHKQPTGVLRKWPLGVCIVAASVLLAAQGGKRFLRFDEAKEILEGFASSGFSGSGGKDSLTWDLQIRSLDAQIRARVDRGFEDSISNLILYGTSYTALPRFEDSDQAESGRGGLTAAALARLKALSQAVEAGIPGKSPRTAEDKKPALAERNERIDLIGDFLRRRGISRTAREDYLSTNLQRFIGEQRAYQEKLKAAGQGAPEQVLLARATLFENRGLSVDTSLLPNYALEDTLRAMARKGALPPRGIRRIAIIGPGLDFADKREGYDFYPLQTLQPFAVMEAVARLNPAASDSLTVVAFDLNGAVLEHIKRLAERGRAGLPYVIQLPLDTQADWRPEPVAYWEHFGEFVGSTSLPLPVPSGLSGVKVRAVAIRPQYAARVSAEDLDIVAQTLDCAPDACFDLVVATNVLVYYDLFQQALAMASLTHLMNPGAILLANHALPAQHPQALEYLGRRSVSYSVSGAYGDDVVVYRRK